MTALGRDLRDGMARVVPLHRPAATSRTEQEVGHQAIAELCDAEVFLDSIGITATEPGEPIGDRLRAHFGLRGVQS